MKNKTAITRMLFAAVALFCLLLTVCHTQKSAAETATEAEEQTVAEVPSVEAEEEPAASETPPTNDAETAAQTETKPTEETDARLLRYLENEPEGKQLILVCAEGTDAVLTRWEKREDAWRPIGDEIYAKVGRNGVSAEKVEGDGKTPSGLFPLTAAFGIEDKPQTEMPYRQVTQESYWVDDPASQFYNQWVEGTAEKDWSSAERLADYVNAYALAAAIGYNSDPVVAGRGSAIFLHCSIGKATSGCVAVPHEAMLDILSWLEPNEKPSILIAKAK